MPIEANEESEFTQHCYFRTNLVLQYLLTYLPCLQVVLVDEADFNKELRSGRFIQPPENDLTYVE